jgi:ABC-type Zn2+ transport system substrate-binding protein/surface adhesin
MSSSNKFNRKSTTTTTSDENNNCLFENNLKIVSSNVKQIEKAKRLMEIRMKKQIDHQKLLKPKPIFTRIKYPSATSINSLHVKESKSGSEDENESDFSYNDETEFQNDDDENDQDDDDDDDDDVFEKPIHILRGKFYEILLKIWIFKMIYILIQFNLATTTSLKILSNKNNPENYIYQRQQLKSTSSNNINNTTSFVSAKPLEQKLRDHNYHKIQKA